MASAAADADEAEDVVSTPAGRGEGVVPWPPVEIAFRGHPRKQGAPEAVRLEDAVPGRTEGRTDPAAFGVPARLEEGITAVPADPSVVDLIPRHVRVPEAYGRALRAPQRLLPFEHGLDGQ